MTPEYIFYPSFDRPQGPNPYENMSKRRWEALMSTWRELLRLGFGAIPGMQLQLVETTATEHPQPLQ